MVIRVKTWLPALLGRHGQNFNPGQGETETLNGVGQRLLSQAASYSPFRVSLQSKGGHHPGSYVTTGTMPCLEPPAIIHHHHLVPPAPASKPECPTSLTTHEEVPACLKDNTTLADGTCFI